MRELEFRAWDKKDGRYLSQDAFVVTSKGKCIFFMIHQGGEMTEYDWSDRTIVEQYTGLKDKNGAKIFENDIVKYKEWFDGYGEYFTELITVIDIEYNFFDDESVGGADGKIWYTDVEIIGNIHTHNEDGTLK